MSKASTPRSPRGRNRSTSVPSAEEQPAQKTDKRAWATYKRKQRSDRFAELVAQFRAAGHAQPKAEKLARAAISEERRIEQRRRRVMKRPPHLHMSEDGSLRFVGSRVSYKSTADLEHDLNIDVRGPAASLPFDEKYTDYYVVSATRQLAAWTPLSRLSKEESAAYAHFALSTMRDFFSASFQDKRLSKIQRDAWGLYASVLAPRTFTAPQVVIEWVATFGFLRSMLQSENAPSAEHPTLVRLSYYWELIAAHLLITRNHFPKDFTFFLLRLMSFIDKSKKRAHIDIGGTTEGSGDDSPSSSATCGPPYLGDSSDDGISVRFKELADQIEAWSRGRGAFHLPPAPELFVPLIEPMPPAVIALPDHLTSGESASSTRGRPRRRKPTA